MAVNSIGRTIDKIIVILFFISITALLYYSSLSQSEGGDTIAAPIYILLSPFVVAFLQFARTVLLQGSYKLGHLGRSWLYIFIYYCLAFLLGSLTNHDVTSYYNIWFVICPPAAWLYFSVVLKANPSLKTTIINWSFWFFLLFAIISLYFIPRSVKLNGLFTALNTSYYVLFAYPLVLLNDSKLKKLIATVLMVIVVLLSLKRGGYASISVAFILYLLFGTETSLLKKTILAAFCVGLLIYLVPKIDDMTNGTLAARLEFSQTGGDDEGRMSMYPIVWRAVWNSDAFEQVFGHGVNTVVTNKVLSGDAAHNDYLEFLYDFGIIGLFLLIYYQMQLFIITRRAQKNKRFFLPTIFAFSIIIVISMVSIVYAFYYFLLIIPFWCIMNQIQIEGSKERIELKR